MTTYYASLDRLNTPTWSITQSPSLFRLLIAALTALDRSLSLPLSFAYSFPHWLHGRGWVREGLSECMSEEWVSERGTGWVSVWVRSEWVSEWERDWVSEWVSEWVSAHWRTDCMGRCRSRCCLPWNWASERRARACDCAKTPSASLRIANINSQSLRPHQILTSAKPKTKSFRCTRISKSGCTYS